MGGDGEEEGDGGGANNNSASSSYWKFFFELKPADGDTLAHYTCLLPPETVSANRQTHQPDITTKGGTSNLKRHLMSTFHKKAAARFEELLGAPHFVAADKAAKQVIDESTQRMTTNSIATLLQSGKRARGDGDVLAAQLMRELAFVCFQINKGLSFNTADDPFLKHFVGVVSHQQALPSRKRVADTLLPLMYSLVMSERDVLWRNVDYFSITTDAWTSVAQDQYLSITIHFIDKSTFRLHSMLLDLVPLAESHTWQNMSRAIAVRLRNLLPPTATLVCTVTDNA